MNTLPRNMANAKIDIMQSDSRLTIKNIAMELVGGLMEYRRKYVKTILILVLRIMPCHR
jgi:hypothetical protein